MYKRQHSGDCDKRFDFADVEGFLKNTAKNTNQQPHYANVVQQTDERSNENNRRKYAKGEDKARTVKQDIHFGPNQRTKNEGATGITVGHHFMDA
ncbi:hypothetical protein JMUB7518_27780 [Staphylococcus aureus]